MAVTCCGSRKNMHACGSALNPWMCQRIVPRRHKAKPTKAAAGGSLLRPHVWQWCGVTHARGPPSSFVVLSFRAAEFLRYKSAIEC